MNDTGIEYEIRNDCGRNIETNGNSNFTQLGKILGNIIHTELKNVNKLLITNIEALKTVMLLTNGLECLLKALHYLLFKYKYVLSIQNK
mgnify:CR=1 FL=1